MVVPPEEKCWIAIKWVRKMANWCFTGIGVRRASLDSRKECQRRGDLVLLSALPASLTPGAQPDQADIRQLNMLMHMLMHIMARAAAGALPRARNSMCMVMNIKDLSPKAKCASAFWDGDSQYCDFHPWWSRQPRARPRRLGHSMTTGGPMPSNPVSDNLRPRKAWWPSASPRTPTWPPATSRSG